MTTHTRSGLRRPLPLRPALSGTIAPVSEVYLGPFSEELAGVSGRPVGHIGAQDAASAKPGGFLAMRGGG
jgi:hypothetical protein